MSAASLGLACALASALGVGLLAVSDPKRNRRAARLSGLRRLGLFAAAAPAIWLAATGRGVSFLIWIGATAMMGWAIVWVVNLRSHRPGRAEPRIDQARI